MDRDLTSCLDYLKSEVAKVTSNSARTCLSNFIEICGALYMAEEEDEHDSQTVVRACREKILKTHQKSTKVLDILLNSETPGKQSAIDNVLNQLKGLGKISDTMDNEFGKAFQCSQCKESLIDNDLARPIVKDRQLEWHRNSVTNGHVNEIVAGLSGLADISNFLQKEEDEAWNTNLYLSQRLERLRVKAGTHPAIEAYTIRNCRSSMAVKKRQEEYVQYAVSVERVLKQVHKATEAIRLSTQKDLSCIVQNLPLLRTLSCTLARLHTSTMEAAASPEATEADNKVNEKDCTSNHGTQSKTPRNRIGKDALVPSEGNGGNPVVEKHYGRVFSSARYSHNVKESPQICAKEKLMAEKLTQALACIGCMRRQVDATLGHVGFTLTDPSGDQGDLSTGDSVPSSSARQFKFMPLDDKPSQKQLIEGTKTLMSAINDLLRVIKAKSKVLESQAVLDKSLCRPFPETAILRLDLIRHLMAQDTTPADPMPSPKRSVNKPIDKSKIHEKVEKTMHAQSPELKYVIKKPPRQPKKTPHEVKG